MADSKTPAAAPKKADPKTVRYRTTKAIDRLEGHVTGKRYTASPDMLILAPEGEFADGNAAVIREAEPDAK